MREIQEAEYKVLLSRFPFISPSNTIKEHLVKLGLTPKQVEEELHKIENNKIILSKIDNLLEELVINEPFYPNVFLYYIRKKRGIKASKVKSYVLVSKTNKNNEKIVLLIKDWKIVRYKINGVREFLLTPHPTIRIPYGKQGILMWAIGDYAVYSKWLYQLISGKRTT